MHGAGDSVVQPRPQTAVAAGHSQINIDWNREGARLLHRFSEPFQLVWQSLDEQSKIASEVVVIMQNESNYVY